MTGHTPWHLRNEHPSRIGGNWTPDPVHAIVVSTAHGDFAVRLNPGIGNSEAASTGRLIVAAPDLLAALEVAEAFMSGFEDDECQEGINEKLSVIRAAIFRARGEGR